MEFPRLGDGSEPQLPAYTTTTATWDLSHVYELHHSSWKFQIPNTLSKARDWIRILVGTSQICFHCATMELPIIFFPIWKSLRFIDVFRQFTLRELLTHLIKIHITPRYFLDTINFCLFVFSLLLDWLFLFLFFSPKLA